MKNRFYDAEMNGVNWATQRTKYAALLDNLVDEEELHTVMMMMIGELNASHTGVSGGPSDSGPSTGTTVPASIHVRFVRLLSRGPHLQDGPADHDYSKCERATTSSRSTTATSARPTTTGSG
jgi:tricorn protease